jgi:hypothetical protein
MYFQLAPQTLRTEGTEFGLLHSVTLARALNMGMLPTPNACDAKMANNKDNHDVQRGYLRGFASAGMLPTPTVNDMKNATLPQSQANRNDSIVKRILNSEIQTGTTSQLNPQFVLEMMGFPPDWTELPFQSGETNQSRPPETP